MLAGADSIDEMALLRHGGMSKVFTSAYAPSTLSRSCERSPSGPYDNSTRSRPGSLLGLAGVTHLLSGDHGQDEKTSTASTAGGYALVDVDDTIIEVHGHQKQGTGFGYSRVRGLNAIPGHPHHCRTRASH